MRAYSLWTATIVVVFLEASTGTLSCNAFGAGTNDQQALIKTAEKAFDATWAALEAGVCDDEDVYTWSLRWANAESRTRGRIAGLESHLSRMKKLHERNETFHESATEHSTPLSYTAFYVLEARILLAEAKKDRQRN